MAAGKLTTQDRKDLDRFTKFLIYKSLQIIVQSRLGEKVKTKSKSVSSGSDWFNLAIRDMSEVQTEAKKSVTWSQLSVGQYVCVETSLKTAEGDSMVLETWYIQVTEQTDPNARVSYTVYNRMGIALKSLYSVTRVTPAYKLSRRQGADNYIICYRVYCTEPQFCQLGEGYQTTKVGCVPTPAGTVNINVAYRVKLLISPQKTSKEVPFEVKDDHFKPDTSPKRTTTPKPCRLGYRRESVCEDLSSQQDAQEGCSTTFSTSPPDIGPPACPANSNIPQSQPIQIQARQPQDSRPDEFRPHSTPERSSFPFSTGYKVGAFAQARSPKDLKSDLEDVPFCNLLQQQPGREKTDVPLQTSASKLQGSRKSLSADNMDNVGTSSGSASGSTKSVSSVSMASAPEDFVMVELKTPFAGTDTNSDLNKFYRECQGAPPLSMFEDQTDVNQTLNEITDQLAMFESSMNDFDSFVSSLHEDD